MNSEIPERRSIDFYEKEGEEFIGEFNISPIPLIYLLELVTPNEDDPLLYDSYLLHELQLAKINAILETQIEYFLDKYEYFLGCTVVDGYYSLSDTIE